MQSNSLIHYRQFFPLGSADMTPHNRTQAEDTVGLIDRISALRGLFQHSDDASDQNALSQLQADARKLMLAVQETNAAFWELVRRVIHPQRPCEYTANYRRL